MSDVELFDFEGQEFRVFNEDGEAWFAATDVAKILGYRDAHNMIRRLDDDEVGTRSASTPAGLRELRVVSLPGLIASILASQVPGAKRFKRLVTHDILPTIMRTGSYSIPAQRQPETPALPSPRELALMVIEAEDAKAALEAQVAELEPAAAAWNEVATAEGSVLVGDAAKMLHHAGIDTGPLRLFKQMETLGWVYRSHSPDTDTYGPWKAKQDQIECGRLLEVPVTFFNRKANARQVGAPQIRVTMKGVEKLHDLMGRKRLALPAN